MTAPPTRLRLPRPPRRIGLGADAPFLGGLLFPAEFIDLAAEWPWFTALGYGRVFTTRLMVKVLLGVGVGCFTCAFLYINLRVAQRGLVPNPFVVQMDGGAVALDVTRMLRRFAWPAALGMALLFGLGAAGGWLNVLRFIHQTPFGVTEPVFGRDVGYYVFTLPLVAGILALLATLTTLSLLAVVLLVCRAP